MDFKALVAVVCVGVSGYLFYLNQTREAVLIELNGKYQAALAGTSAVVTDPALMEAIRASVASEIKARPAVDCKTVSTSGDLARLQELHVQMARIDKRFDAILKTIMKPEGAAEQDERTVEKAIKIKNKILALCKK